MGRIRAAGLPWIDPDDIESSTLRRLDLALLRGLLRPRSERELWAYILAVTDSVVSRRIARARREVAIGVDANGSQELCRANSGADADAAAVLHQVLMSLADNEDRELLFWNLRARTNREIAQAMGMSEAALRQRWSRVCRRLRNAEA
ncbi:MAG: hypothetical protein KF699_02615 [Phycisphaeraceae bacterium]|nr:hypothetical protein [Phycisphaeraceae bacterium]